MIEELATSTTDIILLIALAAIMGFVLTRKKKG
jgi:hypothetical protein